MGIIATLDEKRNVVWEGEKGKKKTEKKTTKKKRYTNGCLRAMTGLGAVYLPLLLPSRLWSNDMNLYETEEEGKMTRQEMMGFFEKVVAATLPRRWPAPMVATWIESLAVFTPDEKRRLKSPRFTGANLVGSELIQPLTEDDIHHKAMGVIKYWTPAEFTAELAKAGIAAGKIPNDFETDIPDGEILYEQFIKGADGLQSMIDDYFKSDELRPLAGKLWANLTLIDDASRARDAHRIFAILEPILKDLCRRQQGFDLVEEATGRNEEVGKEKEGDENRRYGTAKVEEDTHSSDSDPETVSAVDGDGDGEVEDDDGTATRFGTAVLAGATDGDGGETKTSGTNTVSDGPLDLVCRAFAAVAAAGTDKTDTKDASVDDVTTITCSAAAASSAATKEVTRLLPRWIKAYEESDWKCMAVIGKLFTHISETVGQIIIEDKAALAHIRSFFPRAMGGIAGGKKFMEKEMLMKVRQSCLNVFVGWPVVGAWLCCDGEWL